MPDVAATTDELILGLTGAISTQGLYPASHPRVQKALSQAEESLGAALADRGQNELTLLVVDHELAVDGKPWKRASMHCSRLTRMLERRGVERLTLKLEATREEIEALVSGLVGRAELEGSSNVVLGKIAVVGGDEDAEGYGEALEGSLEGCLDGVGRALSLLESDLEGAARVERAVWHLIEATARGSRKFALLASFRTREDRLYRHAVSVCLYAIHLARALGIEGDVLHDLAVSALLHDTGLMAVRPELLDRKGQLSAAERLELQSHPELGATRLSGLRGIPELAVLVAYEHHRHWSGQGGFPQGAGSPSLAAQITAVVDNWDTMMGWTSERLPAERHRFATGGLMQRSGRVLSPFLVKSFLSLMSAADLSPETP